MENPVLFAEKILKFRPLPYQKEILLDGSKRIVLRMCRQSGKSTTLAIKVLWYAVTHPNSTCLILAPSRRQSSLMMDKIHSFISSMEPEIRRSLFKKLMREKVYLRNGSVIVSLPCAEHRLRGFTANLVVLDEVAFFRDDETVIYSIIYPMLSTTDGQLIMSSTPWGTDNVFYRVCFDPGFSKHVVTWREPVKYGLMKREFIEEMKLRIPEERFRMEFEAEFVEETDSFLPKSLLVKAIDSELEPYRFERKYEGTFYIGLDFGKHRDYSVITVLEKRNSENIRLIHFKRFPLGTNYASVIGYCKSICDRWDYVEKICADVTGVGDYIVEDMLETGLPVEGIYFTRRKKEEMANYMKSLMESGALKIFYDKDLISELNVEKYGFTKERYVKFWHPEGTHDDAFWSLALACYASREEEFFVHSVGKVGR